MGFSTCNPFFFLIGRGERLVWPGNMRIGPETWLKEEACRLGWQEAVSRERNGFSEKGWQRRQRHWRRWGRSSEWRR